MIGLKKRFDLILILDVRNCKINPKTLISKFLVFYDEMQTWFRT
jgi:hypothetical protein